MGSVVSYIFQTLGEITTVEATKSASSKILILPLGSTEQHGPHLPLDTDTRITEAIVATLARRYPEQITVAPTLPYGSSGEHNRFVGTMSLSNEVLAEVIKSLLYSSSTYRGTLVVTAHGGNAPIAQKVVSELRTLGVPTGIWFPTRALFIERAEKLLIDPHAGSGILDPDLHAGRTETSIMLALDESKVSMHLAQKGAATKDQSALDQLRERGVYALSPNGVLGDPTGSNKEEGSLLLGVMSEALIEFFKTRYLS